MRAFFNLLIGLLAMTAPAAATVASLDLGGFTVSSSLHVAAAPDKAYAVLIAPSRWWDAAHSYSGNAANMHLDARAGGCRCETLPGGGSAQHMAVDYANPGKGLRLRGTLGPLGAMALSGVMSFSLKPSGDGTDIAFQYQVGGYSPAGFKDLAPSVDGVLMAQLARLKTEIEKP